MFVLETEEVVALKRLKMEKEKEGFPITSLREINTLLKAQHPNIVTVRVNRLAEFIQSLTTFFIYALISMSRLVNPGREPYISLSTVVTWILLSMSEPTMVGLKTSTLPSELVRLY